MTKYQPYLDFTAQSHNVSSLMGLYALLENRPSSKPPLTTFVVFIAFAIESYINSVGSRKIGFWNEIERLAWRKKLEILHNHSGNVSEWGAEPLQFAIEVFRLRDNLAHGKPERIVGPVAYLLEMPISELLDGDSPTIQSFGFAAEHPLPDHMEPGKRGPKVNVEALGNKLMEVLETGIPHSLEQISRDAETTVGAMRYHFPTLVHRLALNWKAHLAAERNRKKAQAREATFNGIQTWQLRHTKPLSRKGLLADLTKETGLPKEVLREAIQQFWIPALSATFDPDRANSAPNRPNYAFRKS